MFGIKKIINLLEHQNFLISEIWNHLVEQGAINKAENIRDVLKENKTSFETLKDIAKVDEPITNISVLDQSIIKGKIYLDRNKTWSPEDSARMKSLWNCGERSLLVYIEKFPNRTPHGIYSFFNRHCGARLKRYSTTLYEPEREIDPVKAAQ